MNDGLNAKGAFAGAPQQQHWGHDAPADVAAARAAELRSRIGEWQQAQGFPVSSLALDSPSPPSMAWHDGGQNGDANKPVGRLDLDPWLPASAPAEAGRTDAWALEAPERPATARAGSSAFDQDKAMELLALKQQLVAVRARKEAGVLKQRLDELRSPGGRSDASPAVSPTGSESPSPRKSGEPASAVAALPTELQKTPVELILEQTHVRDALAQQVAQLGLQLAQERAAHAGLVQHHELQLAAEHQRCEAQLAAARKEQADALQSVQQQRVSIEASLGSELMASNANLRSAQAELEETVWLGNELSVENIRLRQQVQQHAKKIQQQAKQLQTYHATAVQQAPRPTAPAADAVTGATTIAMLQEQQGQEQLPGPEPEPEPEPEPVPEQPQPEPELELEPPAAASTAQSLIDHDRDRLADVAATESETSEQKELRLRTKAHALFEAMDVDDSGLLDEDELQMLLEKLEKEGMMLMTATMMTQSKSGLSSDADAETETAAASVAAGSSSLVIDSNAAMAAIDNDSDGVVDFNEFFVWWLRTVHLMEPQLAPINSDDDDTETSEEEQEDEDEEEEQEDEDEEGLE